MCKEDLPGTVYDPKGFRESLPPDHDGIFDWQWMLDARCFGDTNIAPMDFDGVVERKGHFLVFETKSEGTPVPLGQMYTLQALIETGFFTVIIIWGKRQPVHGIVMYPSGAERRFHGIDECIEKISGWWNYINTKKKWRRLLSNRPKAEYERLSNGLKKK